MKKRIGDIKVNSVVSITFDFIVRHQEAKGTLVESISHFQSLGSDFAERLCLHLSPSDLCETNDNPLETYTDEALANELARRLKNNKETVR